jgi:hypothetical protein
MSTKYVEGECGGLWAHMQHEREGALTMRSATGRETHREEFGFRGRVTTGAHPEGVRRQAHRHRAPRVQHVPDDFVCASLNHRLFYHFRNHRWRKLEQAHAVRMKLSTEVFDEVENSPPCTRPTPRRAATSEEGSSASSTA